MIARIWRGWVATVDRDAYVACIEGTGMAEYRRTPGNQGAYVLTSPTAASTPSNCGATSPPRSRRREGPQPCGGSGQRTSLRPTTQPMSPRISSTFTGDTGSVPVTIA